MYFFEYIKESLSTIRANKLRSGLSLIGIIVGVTSVVSLIGIGNGMKEKINKSFSATNNIITIAQGEDSGGNFFMRNTENTSEQSVTSYETTYNIGKLFRNETIDQLRLLLIENVDAILPVFSDISTTLSYEGEQIYAQLIPGSDAYFRTRKMEIAYGTNFSDVMRKEEQKVLIVGSSTIEDIFHGSNPIGKSIFISGQAFQIIGVMKKTDNFSIDGAIFLPIEVAQKQFGLKKIGSIEIYVQDILYIEKTKKQAYYILSKYFPNDTDKIFHFQTNEQIIKEIEKTTNSFSYFIIGIASISLFVGGIGIMNVMLVSVTERTREIGIRKAIGATRTDIMTQFLIESGTITGIGGIIAIGLSYGIGTLLVSLFPGTISFIIDSSTIFMTTGFSVFMGIFFGLLPAWKAAKKNPIDALRFE